MALPAFPVLGGKLTVNCCFVSPLREGELTWCSLPYLALPWESKANSDTQRLCVCRDELTAAALAVFGFGPVVQGFQGF